MSAQDLHEVLEATGYLVDGQPAPGVCLDDDARKHHFREFLPDALWRSNSALTVYFKFEPDIPSDDQVAKWRREIWNQGFAPLLWVVSPEKVDLYNGFGRPQETGDAAEHRLRTFKRIENELHQLDALAGRLAMETGQFWQNNIVSRDTSVDRQLLLDLAALERKLVAAGLEHLGAQGLIGQSIFTQYLIDRGIVTRQYLENHYDYPTFPDILRDCSATERLFAWLRDTFNGDMFSSHGSTAPSDEHLRKVASFLEATNQESGQRSLFPYQFDVIPVERISSIYEQFAHSDKSTSDTDSQEDVFYTRLSLVSLVLDEITEGLTGEETVLDLTCGSGVFLVEALRRLVNLRSREGGLSRELIRSTLHQQIYGVDISEAAVRVAAFSLYLAALELDPDPQPLQELKFEPLIGKTLIVGDAWNVENTTDVLTQQGDLRKFDVIVGNPPWSYRGQDATAMRRSRGGMQDALPPRGESLDFVYRTMEFASEETRFGLILSAVQFFSLSQTGAAASRQLIETLSPVTLVNLSNQSNWLFSRGNMPAIVLFARHRSVHRDAITAVHVPWSLASDRSHTFEIARSDIVTLPLADWERNPELLKAAFLGSRRDLSLLDRVMSSHPTLEHQFGELNVKFCAGLALGNRSRNSEFLNRLPYLTARDRFQPFCAPNDLHLFGEPRAERPRERDIYRAPLLLVKEFLKRDGHGRPIVAVADRDTVFASDFFGAAFPANRHETAHQFAAILSSSLASWFFLMTASTFGLWMQRIKIGDIKRMPVPDMEASMSSIAGEYLAEFAQKLWLQEPPPGDQDWQTLDEAVFDLYDMNEADRIVVRDGLFRASWQWKRGRNVSVQPTRVEHLLNYAHVFLKAVEVWLSAANRRHMRAEVFELPERAPLRVVRFVLEECPGYSVAKVISPEGSLKDVLNRIGERMEFPLASHLVGQRELRVHGSNEVVIIKPAARRHWMGVSALEDADSVVVESFSKSAV